MSFSPQQVAETVSEATGADIATGRRGKKDKSNSGKSPVQIAMARLRKDKIAMICAGIIVLYVLIAIFAPLLAGLEGQDPATPHPELLDENGFPTIGQTADHWLGIEPSLGRDLFARFVYGARPSIVIGTFAAIATTVIGVTVGLIAGYFGGWIDSVVSWVIDFILSLPFLLFAIALVPIITSWFGTPLEISDDTVTKVRFGSLIFVLTFFFWAGLARLVRGEVISMREKEFVQAARALGVPTGRILFKEMLPNLVGLIIVSLTLAIPAFISAEAGLSFLGVGLKEPTASWGLTIASATGYYEVQPLYLWVPVIAVSLLVLALSLLGDAIADAFNPNTRR